MAASRSSVRWIRLLIAGGCVLPLTQACGGRSDTQDYLFGSDGTITEAGASSTAGQGTAGTRTGTSGASSTGGTGVTVGGSGSVGGVSVGGTHTAGAGPIGGDVAVGGDGTAGTNIGGTGSGGTGSGGVSVGGTGIAGAAGAPGSTITCGAAQCNGDTQQCCAGFGGFKCIGANQQCAGASLGCTVKSDCPGNELCCISVTGDASAASSCKARCDNMGTGRDRQLCQVDDDCAPPFHFCTETVFGVSICTRRP